MSENYDYWKTHTVEEHEQKIREINNRFVEGKLSRQDVQMEIARLFGEDNPEFEQQQQLEAQINERISPKLRDKLSIEQYFLRREQIKHAFLHADERAEQEVKQEDARITGICLVCGAKCHSKGAEWYCPKCNRRFRKRITKK
jgi:rubrerythrin